MLRLAFIAMLVTTPAVAAPDKPAPDRACPAAFVMAWQNDKEAAFAHIPQRPCWMGTETGRYVCYRDGCVREHVYFEDN